MNKNTAHRAGYQLIFIIDGTSDMKKDENGTSVHFSIQN
jgi:hypothetical protein